MQPMTIILVFFVIWWLMFLPVLSLGNQNKSESGDDRIEGTDPGAPSKPNLKKKMIITTLIAVVLTVAFVYVANSGMVSFRVPR